MYILGGCCAQIGTIDLNFNLRSGGCNEQQSVEGGGEGAGPVPRWTESTHPNPSEESRVASLTP